MASTLEGGAPRDRVLGTGHTTGELGPSDTSDTGSDVTGGPGLIEGDVIGLDHGTNEDPERGSNATAGATLGDMDLDSDTDSTGTGERKTAGREPRTPANIDREPYHIERIPDEPLSGVDSSAPATERTGSRRTAGRTGGTN
jgi:hypothetical protein